MDKLFILILACMLCTQCSTKSDSNSTKRDSSSAKNDTKEKLAPTDGSVLVMNKIDYPDIIGIGMQLIKYGDVLLLNDFHGDSLISVFDLTSHTIRKRLFSRGNGPNEFLSPLELQIMDTTLFINYRQGNSLHAISLNVLDAQPTQSTKLIQMSRSSDRFLPLTSSRFLFSGDWDANRYAIINTAKAEDIVTFGDYPNYWVEEKDIPFDAKAMFHQSWFLKHPSQPLFLSCSGYVLEVFRYNPGTESLPEMLFRKQLGKYAYTYTTGAFLTATVEPGSDPQVCEVACSENYIYLVTGVKSNRYEIRIYDWQGNPVNTLVSDKIISCLTIDEKDKKAYCLITDPEDTLAWFDLPD